MSETQSQEDKESTHQFVLASGISGGVAGVVIDFIVYPIETIKTQIQASNSKINFRELAGKNSKYKGFSAQFVSAFPFAFLYFFTYEQFKMIQKKSASYNIYLQQMIAAALAEGLGNVFRCPFEQIKSQQQVGLDKRISETIKNIYSIHGIKGFYVGLGALLIRDIPFSMIQYPLFDKMRQYEKNKKRESKGLPSDAQVELSFFESCKCGAVASSIASFLTTPLDVLKTKLMTSREQYYKGFFDAFKKVVSEEGYSALFKGVKWRVLPFSFTGTIYFTVYEQTRIQMSKLLVH